MGLVRFKVGSSFSLAAGEKKTVETAHTTGVTSQSSSLSTISAALGTNVSANYWGVHASLSASLATSNTTMQQNSFHEQNQVIVTVEADNTGSTTSDKVYINWALESVYTFVKITPNSQNTNVTYEIKSKIFVRESPVIVKSGTL